MTRAELNHLRRMVAWVRCDIWQSPEEMQATVAEVLPKLEDVSEEGKARLIESYRRAESVPKYLRAAVKSLEKFVKENDGYGIVDGESRAESQVDDDKQIELIK